ncbi:MAG: hypothetical protein GAK31_00928 [Stenotrophomonas maltophilia]|uniref:Phage tail protein n=1 Tax=Stenotrophomonas maltophilia TaxID=40324 RepID=A0A7V8FK86_STEMA|nr:MAG: hypothetical protein GAK31_00928 [Stenotrophomonas maltophilia]
MGLNIRPDYKITANDKDITAIIADRLKSLRLTDEAGVTSDMLEITLADHDPDKPIALPPTGAELELFIGYDGDVRRKGLFVCDEIEMSGYPCEMVIRARAAPYDGTKAGKKDLQAQKTRSWKAKTTIGDMVKTMAGEHGMEASVSADLAAIALPHTDQVHESDMNLLARLAKRYDAIAKPAGGKLLFVKRGESKTASGAAMPEFTLTPQDVSQWRVSLATRDSAGTVVARYRDIGAAKTKQIAVGEGDPVRQLRMAYKDQASALAAAKSEQRKRARSERSVSVQIPGNPDIVAESMMTIEGFRDGVDGQWLVNRVEHEIGPQGFVSRVEGEQPNKDKGVAKADGKVKVWDAG